MIDTIIKPAMHLKKPVRVNCILLWKFSELSIQCVTINRVCNLCISIFVRSIPSIIVNIYSSLIKARSVYLTLIYRMRITKTHQNINQSVPGITGYNLVTLKLNNRYLVGLLSQSVHFWLVQRGCCTVHVQFISSAARGSGNVLSIPC